MNAGLAMGALTLCVSAAGAVARGAEAAAPPLAGTHWRLVEFQSMDDRQGITRPAEGSLYTMWLHGDGTVAMQLNCNRATGAWSAAPGGDAASGRFEFGPLAATRAPCPPPSMDQGAVAQSKFVRSYLLKDDRLYLSLMADGGIYVWARNGSTSPEAVLPAAPENGGPRNWVVAAALNLREQPSASPSTMNQYDRGSSNVAWDEGWWWTCQRSSGASLRAS